RIDSVDLDLAINFPFQGCRRQVDRKEPQSAQVRMSGCRLLRTRQNGKYQRYHHDANETVHHVVLLFYQRSSAAFVSSKEVPSANVIFCRYPYSERSLAPTPSTLTACPIDFAKSARPTPTRRNHAGGLLSKTQLAAFPSSAFASM